MLPEIVVGPVALSVQSVAAAVPPAVLSTVLLRVKLGWLRCAGCAVGRGRHRPDAQIVQEDGRVEMVVTLIEE